MRNFTRLLFTGFILLMFSYWGTAQQNRQVTTVVGKLIRTTAPLSEIDQNSMYGQPFERTRDESGLIGISGKKVGFKKDYYPTAKSFGDEALQNLTTPAPAASSAVINQNFDGLSATGFAPSDNNLAVGPNHVIQIINNGSSSLFKIWNKAGTQVQAQTVLSSITGIAGGGDPVVMYDQIADRWILTEFTGSSPNALIWAVSTTSDPTGAYKIYSYNVGTYFADYPHYSVWHNAYYGITHDFNTALTAYLGSSIMAFDKAAMIAGAPTATMVSFRFADNRSFTMLPVHQEGPAVSNQSGLFTFFQDDTDTPAPGDVDSVFTFTYTPNFTTPSSSVIGPMVSVVATPFNSTLCGVAACITQPAGGQAIRGIEGQIMHKVGYRNFGGFESMVANFTTNAGSGIGGIRWWEMRRTGGAGNWSMYQEGTFAPPDGNHRFMGSIAQNALGDIGLIFNVTGSGTPSTFPSFRLTGRTTCDPLGQMTIPETSIMEGTVLNGNNRYGDYNALNADPVNGSFWGTGQYNRTGLGTFGNWATRVVNFSITGGAASITSQPANASVCVGTTASFSVTAVGGAPLGYQWQVSTDGGATWTNVTGATAATYSFTAVAGDNGKRFRANVTSACPQVATSNAATLTITTLSAGGNITPASSNACAGANSTVLTLAGHIGNILQWESSVNAGVTWTVIANTTTTLTATNITQTTQYRALVQSSGCSAAYSATATINFIAAGVGALTITTDNGTTLCAGDPTLLTAVGLTTNSFSSATAISIPSSGAATPYPSNITVSGLGTSGVKVKSVTLNNVAHTFPSDIDIVLQSPTGQNVVLMSDAGSGTDATGQTFTFDDAATALMNNTFNPTGTYRPTNIGAADTWIAPGPGALNQPTPSLGTFTGDPNGVWKLFVVDDLGGDLGTIAGFSITFATTAVIPGLNYTWSPAAGLNATNTNPVAASPATSTTYTVVASNSSGCSGTASIAITVNQRPAVTAQPANTSACSGTAVTFTVTATGTGISYQWQESTNGGVSYSNLSNTAPYSGVATPTLSINPAAAAMNSNRYRCVINGICAPAANSNGAILTVVALPAVTVTPTSGCGGVAGINGLLLTASGANTYTWSPAAGLFTNAIATTGYVAGTQTATVYAAPAAFTSYTVTGTNTATGCSGIATALINYTPPAPTVTPNPVAMCLGDAAVLLKSSSSQSFTGNFKSGTVNIAIPDGPAIPPVPTSYPATTSNITVSGIPTGATISNIRARINATHDWVSDLVIVLKAPNGNVFNLDALLSGTNKPGVNFTNTVISSASLNSLGAGTAPYTGIFKADAAGTTFTAFGFTFPGGPTGFIPNVTAFNNLYSVPNGTWTLAIYDAGAPDAGTLNNWELDIDYIVGVPAAPAVWTPVTGLFTNPAGTNAYIAGTPVDSVYARPTTIGANNYQVTVNSLPPAPATAATNFAANNSNSTITFNVRNNNPYAVTLSDIASVCNAAGVSQVSAYYKPSAINGLPGAISTANGWTQIGSTATITGIGGGTVQPFLTGLSLTIPPGATYGVCVQALLGTGFNLAYSTIAAGTYTFSAAGCDIITGTNIGYGGVNVPAAPTFTPRGFIGRVGFTTTVTACTSPARTVVVTVNQPVSITADPVNAAVCTDKVTSFSVTATGTTPTYRWQVSTDNGNIFNNVSNGGVYAGAATATLTITAPPVSMSGYLYRAIVSGAAPCGPDTSAQRLLTVNPLPTIVISASPYQKLFPGLTTTLFSTVTPAAATYTWLRNGTAIANATGSSLIVNVDGLGDYRVRVTDVNGCSNTSNLVSLTDSVSGKVFVYPNPNSGQFQVRYYSIINNTGLPRGVNIYDARGKRISTQVYSISSPYARMDVDLRNHGTGVYWVEVVDANGNRLAMGRTQVLR